MKAWIYRRYGPPDVLEMTEIARSVPRQNEVLIKVHATTVNSGDWRLRSLELPRGFGLLGRMLFGFWGPRKPVLGMELAGEIVATGNKVDNFKTGDRVFADTSEGYGAHAQFRTIDADGPLALIPDGIGYNEAAAICFGGTTALHFLRQLGNIKPGETVLINGASGTTGTAFVQLAKFFGAEVTGVCSTGNIELVKSIGADMVIDYLNEDFTKNGKHYDLIIDTAGTAPWSRSKPSLAKTGRLLLVNGSLADMLKSAFVSKKHGKKLISGVAMGRPEDLRFLAGLVGAGQFTPVIDCTFPFEKMREAHALVDTGHKRGSVVVTL